MYAYSEEWNTRERSRILGSFLDNINQSQPEPVNLSTRPSSLPSSTHSIHPKLIKPSVNVVFVRSRVLVLVPKRETDDRGEEMNLPGQQPRPRWHIQTTGKD